MFFTGWPELFRTAKIWNDQNLGIGLSYCSFNRFQSLHPCIVLADIEGLAYLC